MEGIRLQANLARIVGLPVRLLRHQFHVSICVERAAAGVST